VTLQKPDKTKVRQITRRAGLLLGGQVMFMGVLGWRMRDLGVKQNAQFRLLAEENRINIQLVPPTRGLIYDRQGRLIANNIPQYRVQMVREQIKAPEVILDRLAQLIPISPKQHDHVLSLMKRRRSWVPVTVAEDLTWEHIAAVAANAPALPGVTPVVGSYREYIYPHEYSHIVGYVGPVSDYDLSKTDDDDPVLRIPRFQIGKNGIEAKIEKQLRGIAEIKRIEVNSVGRVMRDLDRKAGASGKNIQITIDTELQTAALKRIQGESAAAVVIDVRNGDILALASAPTYDPNKFVTGISTTDWNALLNNKYRPLANKTVSGTYPPGSTYKMVVALAALEAGITDGNDHVNCKGYVEVYKQRFHCWRRGGHGKVDMVRALRESCDVYFYDIAQKVGIEKISDVARRLGLGVRHDLPLPAVHKGLAPTKAWKRKTKGKDWRVGDTLNAGIGQGYTLSSPLQLALMAARLGAGTQIEPRLINSIGDELLPIKGNIPLDFDPKHLDIVRRGMFEVVNHARGTARGSRITLPGVKMAGKTGTSQVKRITASERKRGVIRNADLPWERRDHALFVAFAPHDNPKYAISVIVEHGGGGSKAAAPIARDIMQAALLLDDTGYGAMPSQKRRTDDPDEQTPHIISTKTDPV